MVEEASGGSSGLRIDREELTASFANLRADDLLIRIEDDARECRGSQLHQQCQSSVHVHRFDRTTPFGPGRCESAEPVVEVVQAFSNPSHPASSFILDVAPAATHARSVAEGARRNPPLPPRRPRSL